MSFSEYTVNLGGHNRSSVETVKYDDLSNHHKRFINHCIKDAVKRKSVKDNDNKLKQIHKRIIIGVDRFTCEHCGERFYVDVDVDKKTITTGIIDQTTFELIDNAVCKYSEGFPEFSVQINVPSGKLVFGNDFRNLITIDDDDAHDINHVQGKIKYSKNNADAGLVLLFVGNTCPSVFKKDDQLLIMNQEYDHEIDDYKEDPTLQNLGSICTDLWWFSAMDYDHFMIAQEELRNDDPDSYEEIEFDNNTFIVDVEPGRYEFSSRHHLLKDEDNELYSIGKRIGNCVIVEKPEEILTGDDLLDSVFWKTWQKDKNRYKGAYPTMTRLAEHMFCILGNGYVWDRGILRTGSRREDVRWANLEGKFSGFYEEGQTPWRKGVAIYDQIPDWPQKSIEKFRGDGKYGFHSVCPMHREYVAGGSMSTKVDIFYLAFAMMFFKMLYENQHLLDDGSKTPNRKVGADKYGTELDPDRKGMLLKIGVLTQEDVDELNRKTKNEQIAIVNGCLDLMFALVAETGRYQELLKVFKLFDRDFVMKEM